MPLRGVAWRGGAAEAAVYSPAGPAWARRAVSQLPVVVVMLARLLLGSTAGRSPGSSLPRALAVRRAPRGPCAGSSLLSGLPLSIALLLVIAHLASAAWLLPDTSGIDGQLTANLNVDQFFGLWLVFNDETLSLSGGCRVSSGPCPAGVERVMTVHASSSGSTKG